eukprot:19259_1
MRTGYQDSFFFNDHSIVNYTNILQLLIENNIQCGNKLPNSSTGKEVEDVITLSMFIVCVVSFWIYFIRKATKTHSKGQENRHEKQHKKPPITEPYVFLFLIALIMETRFYEFKPVG